MPEASWRPASTGCCPGRWGSCGFVWRDVMAPADDLVTVPSTATLAEAEALVHDSGHSRVLVTDGGWRVGFLHAKDLLSVAR